MSKQERCYAVVWWDCDGKRLGFLPFSEIPVGNILRKALFSSTECLQVEGGGLRGIYDDKRLARAHLQLEDMWRNKGKRKKDLSSFYIREL